MNMICDGAEGAEAKVVAWGGGRGEGEGERYAASQ